MRGYCYKAFENRHTPHWCELPDLEALVDPEGLESLEVLGSLVIQLNLEALVSLVGPAVLWPLEVQ